MVLNTAVDCTYRQTYSPKLWGWEAGGGGGGGGVKNLLAVIGFKQVGHQSGFEYSG